MANAIIRRRMRKIEAARAVKEASETISITETAPVTTEEVATEVVSTEEPIKTAIKKKKTTTNLTE